MAHLARHPYRGGLAVKLGSLEVNSVSILFSKHGADRRQRNLGRRVGGIGREILWQEKNISERIVSVCFRDKGEIRWQQARRETRNTRKDISQRTYPRSCRSRSGRLCASSFC